MTETVLAPRDPLEFDGSKEAVGQLETPIKQLALEGLKEVAKRGYFSEEDAMRHYRSFFPETSELPE